MSNDVVRFRVSGDTHVGKVRDNNEDNLLVVADLERPDDTNNRQNEVVLSTPGGLFLVADGMGGGAAGEVASGLTVQTAREEVTNLRIGDDADHEIASLLKRIIRLAHDKIADYANRDINLMGMGTTATVCLLHAGKLYVAWSGDSRLYRYNEAGVDRSKTYNLPTLEIVTREHSVVWEMVERGELTAEGARHHEKSHIITQNLGFVEDPPHPDVMVMPIRQGDRFLLCSDGLNSMIPDNKIADLLEVESDTDAAVSKLIEAANAAGGHDNVTIILIDVLSAPLKPAKVGSVTHVAGDTLTVASNTAAADVSLPQAVNAAPPTGNSGASMRPPPPPLPGKRKSWVILILYLALLLTGLFAAYQGYEYVSNMPAEGSEELAPDRSEERKLLLELIGEQEVRLRSLKVNSRPQFKKEISSLRNEISNYKWDSYAADSVRIVSLEQKIGTQRTKEYRENKREEGKGSLVSEPMPPALPKVPKETGNSQQIEVENEGVTPNLVPGVGDERPGASLSGSEDLALTDDEVDSLAAGDTVKNSSSPNGNSIVKAGKTASQLELFASARMRVESMVRVADFKNRELEGIQRKIKGSNGRVSPKIQYRIDYMDRWNADILNATDDLEAAISNRDIPTIKACAKRAENFLDEVSKWLSVN